MAPKRAPAPLITYGKQPHKKRRRLPSSFFDLNPAAAAAMGFVPAKHNPEPLVPKRPDSQKAATMAVEPDQQTIETFKNFTNCDDSTARRYLRVRQNNLEQAVSTFYEEPDISKLEQSNTWDESAFTADREGNQNLHPLGTSAAPTRGPSPAPSLGLTQPKNKDDEDIELQRALAASRGEELPFTQESGVVNNDGSEVKFGPATRDQYDERQWAMIPASQEIVPDVPAKNREYRQGQGPRFLKHLPDGDYTPNFIAICHSIAKLREAFLMRQHIKPDYGNETDWWRGQPISLPRIVNTADNTPADPDVDKYDELIAEVQRLMAFLDCSQRTYASIGGITQSEMIKNNEANSDRPGSLLELFLLGWMEAASNRLDADDQKDQIRKLFTTTIGTNAATGMADPNLRVVDLTVKSTNENSNLLELLDDLLWDTDPSEDDIPDNFIEDPAEFLVMRVQHASPSAPKLGVDVPSFFHVDKYLKQNIASTRSIRQDMARGKKRVAKIEEIEKKLKSWQHPNKSAQIESRELLNHALGHFSGQKRKDVEKAALITRAPLANHEPEHYPDVASKLEQIIANIDKKLEVLAEEKAKTLKAVSELSTAPPADVEKSDVQPRYMLRGVATKPNITYILQPKEDDDQDMTSSNDGDMTPPGYQWWRIAYEVSGSHASIMKSKCGDYDVTRAVELEHTSALLVYGNEESCNWEAYWDPDIPEALRGFVHKDDEQFQHELRDAELPSYNIISNDTSEVRRSIEGRSSMDSMRVGGGDSDEEPLLDNDELSAQHYAYGLGYDVNKSAAMEPPERTKTPVDEIRLGPEEDMFAPNSTTEMVEKPGHEPLVPRPGTGSGGDTAMGGMESQDMGVGGAAHVEDAGAHSK